MFDSGTFVSGRASIYLHDMVSLQDGTIIISDSSPTYDYLNDFWIRFEGRPDGRLLGFNPSNGQAKEILSGLAYPTGLELTSDKQALLVAEAGRARILRIELSKDKFFQKSNFNGNLPGMPEHIRRSNRGTYWVGLTYARFHGETSVMDQYSNMASSRNFLARRRTMEQLRMMYNQRGLAVEMDEAGRVLASMHDSIGLKVKDVLEVMEHEGVAYVGTRGQNAVIRVIKSQNDLTITSVVQVLRGRCKIQEDKVSLAKSNLEQQILTRRGATRGTLGNFLTAPTLDLTVQSYQTPNIATGQSYQTPNIGAGQSYPTPNVATGYGFAQPQRPAANAQPQTTPNRRLDTIRQGLAKLHSTLSAGLSIPRPTQMPTGPGNLPRVLPQQYNQYNSGFPNLLSRNQSVLFAHSEDPFLPAGFPPIKFPLDGNIPQSDTGKRPPVNAASQSSPLVVHKMENGELVTHILIGNDFKPQTPKPTPSSTTPATHTTPMNLVEAAQVEAKIAGVHHMGQNGIQHLTPHEPQHLPHDPNSSFGHPPPVTHDPHSSVGHPPPATRDLNASFGGFFEFLQGAASKKNEALATTPGAPLPDHGPLLADSPYLPVANPNEIYNKTPDFDSSFGLHNLGAISGHQQPVTDAGHGPSQKRPESSLQDISNKTPMDLQQMQMFHPSDRPDASVLNQARTKAQSPLDPTKTSFLKQGLRMLQQYFKQNKPTNGAAQSPAQHTNQAADIGVTNSTKTPNNTHTTEPVPPVTTVTPTSTSRPESTTLALPQEKDMFSQMEEISQVSANDVIKSQQLASFSGAATIHPNQPLNEVANTYEHPHFKTSNPAAASDPSLASGSTAAQPMLDAGPSGATDESNFIKIVQGPGKYILIPLTRSTLLQALSGLPLGSLDTTLSGQTQGQPTQGQPTQGQPTQGQPTQGQPTQGQPTQGQPTQGQPTQGQPTQGQPTQGQPTQGQPTQGQPTQGQPTQGQPTQGQPTQGQPTQGQPTQGQPIQSQAYYSPMQQQWQPQGPTQNYFPQTSQQSWNNPQTRAPYSGGPQPYSSGPQPYSGGPQPYSGGPQTNWGPPQPTSPSSTAGWTGGNELQGWATRSSPAVQSNWPTQPTQPGSSQSSAYRAPEPTGVPNQTWMQTSALSQPWPTNSPLQQMWPTNIPPQQTWPTPGNNWPPGYAPTWQGSNPPPQTWPPASTSQQTWPSPNTPQAYQQTWGPQVTPTQSSSQQTIQTMAPTLSSNWNSNPTQETWNPSRTPPQPWPTSSGQQSAAGSHANGTTAADVGSAQSKNATAIETSANNQDTAYVTEWQSTV
ncbi:mucin-2-like isoform X2 [Physella acuta]|nr:mucin-2-like isoform X2 [Physella acuta]